MESTEPKEEVRFVAVSATDQMEHARKMYRDGNLKAAEGAYVKAMKMTMEEGLTRLMDINTQRKEHKNARYCSEALEALQKKEVLDLNFVALLENEL